MIPLYQWDKEYTGAASSQMLWRLNQQGLLRISTTYGERISRQEAIDAVENALQAHTDETDKTLTSTPTT